MNSQSCQNGNLVDNDIDEAVIKEPLQQLPSPLSIDDCENKIDDTVSTYHDNDGGKVQQNCKTDNAYCVLAFYQFFAFTALSNVEESSNDISTSTTTTITTTPIEQQWRNDMESTLRSYHVYGMIRVSIHEGMNGSICFLTHHLHDIEQYLRQQHHRCRRKDSETDIMNDKDTINVSPLKIRISYYNAPPFHRLSIRIKKEIVTMGTIPQNWIENDSQNDAADSIQNEAYEESLQQCYVRPYQHNMNAGIYVPPGKEWDELLYDPHCLIIDTRNEYEIQMGTFRNAISPNTNEFTEFPAWLHTQLQQQQQTNHEQQNTNLKKYNKIAMFCTGGIRCEKATALCIQMLHRSTNHDSTTENEGNINLPPVYHLEGGILAYLENNNINNTVKDSQDNVGNSLECNHSSMSGQTNTSVDESCNTNEQEQLSNSNVTNVQTKTYGNNFIGECFVFDQRVAVTYGLQPTNHYVSCHACRRPVHTNDTINNYPKYQEGICCPSCYNDYTEKNNNNNNTSNKQRSIERQKQIELSKLRQSSPHIYDSKYNNLMKK